MISPTSGGISAPKGGRGLTGDGESIPFRCGLPPASLAGTFVGKTNKIVAIATGQGIIAPTLLPGDARWTGEAGLRDRREYGSMTNTMMMDRTGMGMSGMGMPSMAPSAMGGTAAPMMPNMLMVPRCTMKM